MTEKKFHVGIKALIRNSEGKILVLTEAKHDKLRWDLPGGRISEGDSPEGTLVKELEEELNYYGAINELKLFHGFISNTEVSSDGEKFGLVLFVYKCRLDEEEISPSTQSEFKWITIEEAKKLLAWKYTPDFIRKLNELEEPEI